MFATIAAILEAGLSIWDHKEKNKYRDRLMDLRKDYWDEYNKDPNSRSDARLDELEFELRNLASGWAAQVGASNIKAPDGSASS